MRTRSPWWLHGEYSTIYVEGPGSDPHIVQEVAAVGPKEGGREQQIADAILIVSAPDMLCALQACDKLLAGVSCTDYPVQDEWDMVKKAIRKATQP